MQFLRNIGRQRERDRIITENYRQEDEIRNFVEELAEKRCQWLGHVKRTDSQ
jgi:hypothetical protein